MIARRAFLGLLATAAAAPFLPAQPVARTGIAIRFIQQWDAAEQAIMFTPFDCLAGVPVYNDCAGWVMVDADEAPL